MNPSSRSRYSASRSSAVVGAQAAKIDYHKPCHRAAIKHLRTNSWALSAQPADNDMLVCCWSGHSMHRSTGSKFRRAISKRIVGHRCVLRAGGFYYVRLLHASGFACSKRARQIVLHRRQLQTRMHWLQESWRVSSSGRARHPPLNVSRNAANRLRPSSPGATILTPMPLLGSTQRTTQSNSIGFSASS